MKIIITVPATVSHKDIVDSVNALVLSNDAFQGITIDTVLPKMSKADKIIAECAEIVENGEFVDRNAIAESVGCTVSLISATFKAESDNESVIAYLAMERKAKDAKKLATMQRRLAELQASIEAGL